MKIIKRSGKEVGFDISKIMAAVQKANREVNEADRMTDKQIDVISDNVQTLCMEMTHTPSVEEIQDMVENQIMKQLAFEVARKYITYRYKRALIRKSNSTDEQILTLIECNNEEVKQENSNKNPVVNSVQRDYMAGEVSKDITRRFLLPPDIVKAHENIVKVQKIVEEFRSTLDHKYPVSEDFDRVYVYLLQRLLDANIKKDIAILEEVNTHLRTMRDTWKEVMRVNKENHKG